MQFLLGLLAFILVCFLVGKVFFYKEFDPDRRMRKGILLTLSLTVLGIVAVLLIVYKGDTKNSKNSDTTPYVSTKVEQHENKVTKVKIKSVDQVQKNSEEGLEITLDGDFRNLGSDSMNFAIWFYFGEKGEYDNGFSPLKDFNNEYGTTDEQVTVQTGYVVFPNNGFIDPNSIPKLFIPISELHLNRNYSDINESRILTSEKIKKNNRIGLKAGVFQGDEELSDSDLWIFTVQ